MSSSRQQYGVSLDTIKAQYQALTQFILERDGNLDALGLLGDTFRELVSNYQGQRYPIELVSHAIEQFSQQINEPWLGLKLAQSISDQHQQFDQLMEALDCSPLDYLKAFSRYVLLCTEVFQLQATEFNADIVVTLIPNRADTVSRHQVEAFISILSNMITDRFSLPVTAINFCHQAVNEETSYLEYFAVIPSFGQPQNCILFKRPCTEKSITNLSEKTIRVLREHELQYNKTFNSSWRSRCEFLLELLMVFGAADKITLAEILTLTPRTLQRRLAQENTSFREILQQLRMRLADNYLRQQQMSTENLAFVLGYSDGSQLHKSFREWFGMGIAQYRASSTEKKT